MNAEHTHTQLRRRAPRFPVKAPIEIDWNGNTIPGFSINLSLVGLHCLVEEPLVELSQVTLRIALPVTMPDTGEVETQVVEAPALVVRTESTDARAAAALMFGELPIETEWVMGRYILETFDGVTRDALSRPEAGATLR